MTLLLNTRKLIVQNCVEKETKEKDILSKYLPAQKSEEEIRSTVRGIIAGIAQEQRNQGNIMKAVMPQLKGLADGNLVRQIVTEEITKYIGRIS